MGRSCHSRLTPAGEANTRILERYRIPSDRSLNLQTL